MKENYVIQNSTEIEYSSSSYAQFQTIASRCIDDFEVDNKVIDLIVAKQLTHNHFHQLLRTIFHQVYMSSTSFALAGVSLDSRYSDIREYLFHHAEEEQDHWKWIIQNLRETGDAGADPRNSFPPVAAQAYISFAMFLASRQPVARLAMAYVLEGISGKFAVEYGRKAAELLQLTRKQMSFYIQHGELDAGHSDDILEVLKNAQLSAYEWAWCTYAAECTTVMYKAMYNSIV